MGHPSSFGIESLKIAMKPLKKSSQPKMCHNFFLDKNFGGAVRVRV